MSTATLAPPKRPAQTPHRLELEGLLIRAARRLIPDASAIDPLTLSDAKLILAKALPRMDSEAPTSGHTPIPEPVLKDLADYYRGRSHKNPRARIRTTQKLRPFSYAQRPRTYRNKRASGSQELETRLRAIDKIARNMVTPPTGEGILPRTSIDDRLEAIVTERNAGDVLTGELAYVYDLPPHLVELWLEHVPDPLDGLYDDDDDTEPAQLRGGEFDPTEGLSLASFQTGLPEGRHKVARNLAAEVEAATGYSLERCRSLLCAKARQHGERVKGRMLSERLWLESMLANMLARGEATVTGLAATLGCARKTIQRIKQGGERDATFEPIPLTGRPDWTPTPKHAPVTTRWVDPEPQKRTKSTLELPRRPIYDTAPGGEDWKRKLYPPFDSTRELGNRVPLAPYGKDPRWEKPANKLLGEEPIP
jgi:hypothetical protein